MVRRLLSLGLVGTTFALAGCMAGGPPRIPVERIDRALEGAPGEAQPSKLVATELAFARAAQEDGQWTATRAFAGPGAMIHGQSGAIPAMSWLQKQSDPPKAVKWSPREIWMSCDGALAVSQGRFVDAEGLVGTYLTVWQRNDGGDYRWVYDSAQADNPQPPARNRPEAQEGDIVVTALDAVQGNVADCRTTGPRTAEHVEDLADATRYAPDGTLSYRWEHRSGANGPERHFTAYWLHEGKWQVAVEEVWAGS